MAPFMGIIQSPEAMLMGLIMITSGEKPARIVIPSIQPTPQAKLYLYTRTQKEKKMKQRNHKLTIADSILNQLTVNSKLPSKFDN